MDEQDRRDRIELAKVGERMTRSKGRTPAPSLEDRGANSMMTEEQIVARLLAGRLDKPPQPAPPPKPEAKAQDRWTAPKPPEAIAAQAAVSTEALAEVVTQEDRRSQQMAKEIAEWNAQDRYVRELNRWWQAKQEIEAAIEPDYVMVGGFLEPRYKTTCHKGKGDPDWGLR